MRKLTITCAAVAGAAIWAACLDVATAQTEVPSQTIWGGVFTEAQAYRGEKVADTTCIGCHGAGLTGGDSGPKLVGTKFLSDWRGQSLGELFDWISESMPDDAPGTLSKSDAVLVLAYILKMNQLPTGKQDLPIDRAALARIAIVADKP